MKLNYSNELINFSDFQGEEIICNKGEFLFREGEKERGVYFLHEGSIKILNGKWIHWIVEPNELIAISSFFSISNKYIFSAKAIKKCKLTKFDREEFQKMLRDNPLFSDEVIKSLCKKIEFTHSRVNSVLWDNSWTRLINELLNAVKDNLKINLSLEELSQLVGVSKRRVRSMISELEQKSILKRTRDSITILDLRGLEIICEMKKYK